MLLVIRAVRFDKVFPSTSAMFGTLRKNKSQPKLAAPAAREHDDHDTSIPLYANLKE